MPPNFSSFSIRGAAGDLDRLPFAASCFASEVLVAMSVFPFAVEDASEAATSGALAARRPSSLLKGDASRASVPGRCLLGLPDARCLAELLGHIEMVLERRQRLAGPILQRGIVAALGVAFEQ